MIKHHEHNDTNFLINLIVQEIHSISSRDINIVLQWIPSHRGIVGNNIVDQVAKEACSYNTITYLPLVFSDFINILKKNCI